MDTKLHRYDDSKGTILIVLVKASKIMHICDCNISLHEPYIMI